MNARLGDYQPLPKRKKYNITIQLNKPTEDGTTKLSFVGINETTLFGMTAEANANGDIFKVEEVI